MGILFFQLICLVFVSNKYIAATHLKRVPSFQKSQFYTSDLEKCDAIEKTQSLSFLHKGKYFFKKLIVTRHSEIWKRTHLQFRKIGIHVCGDAETVKDLFARINGAVYKTMKCMNYAEGA